MEITIKELKEKFLSSHTNDPVINSDNLNEINNYQFQSRNSKNILENDELRLNGLVCLHSKNYKTILIDKTDWIYIEFLNCAQNEETSSKLPLYLRTYHLLKQLKIHNFNIFTESFILKKKNSSKNENNLEKKIIFYLQTDLSQCEISANEKLCKNIQSSHELSQDGQFSLYKTIELKKYFTENRLTNNIIDESLDDSAMLTDNTYKIDLNQLNIDENDQENYYLFKVVNIGCVNSLANTQYKSKLRADIQIELTLLGSKKKYQTIFIVLALMSKFLCFYNFFYKNNFYILKAKEKLNFAFKPFNAGKRLENKTPIGIIFLDDKMSITDEIETPAANYQSLFSQENSALNEISNQDYVHSLNGVLIEKKLKSNSSRADLDFSFTLMQHFDLFIPNQEFKLTIRLETSQAESLITVYYDTRFSIYSLCILPGVEINLNGLVKKYDNVYKTNLNITPLQSQNMNLFNLKQANTDLKIRDKEFFQSIEEFDYLFNKVYLEPLINKKLTSNMKFKIDLLFPDQNSGQNSITVLAQILKIFDLRLRLKCGICEMLANVCKCVINGSNFKIEFSATFLIDDHTSILKVAYHNCNYDLKRCEIFGAISEQVNFILRNYLNEIKVSNVPLQLMSLNEFCNENESEMSSFLNRKIYEGIKERLNVDQSKMGNRILANQNSFNNSSLDGLNQINSLDAFYENNVKMDIYKTIYDFLNFAVLERYFIFLVEVEQFCSVKSSCRTKLESSLFRLGELSSNEQFKSVFSFKCRQFFTAEKYLNQ